MFSSSFTRSLTTKIKCILMPTVLRLNARPMLCSKRFSNCQGDLGKQQGDSFISESIARLPINYKVAGEQNGKKNLKIEKRELPHKSAWEYPPECCGNPCPDLLPRFDTLYYKPTDKLTKQYQQTWIECPPPKVRQRKVWCYDLAELPPVYRRKKIECPTTAREHDSRKMKAISSYGVNKKCPHTQAPCCPRGRYPPTCRISKTISNCKKKRCPLPSYSECSHPTSPPLKRDECSFAVTPAICEVVRYLRRKLLYDLPPPLPAWPN